VRRPATKIWYLLHLALGNSSFTEQDQSLLNDLSLGDSAVFWRIWQKYERYLYQICLRKARGRSHDADELLSGVMLKALDRLPLHAANISNLKGWLAALARNFCTDALRRSSRESQLEFIDQIPDETCESRWGLKKR